MNAMQKKMRGVGLFAVALAAAFARADDAVWNKTAGGNYDWSVSANWLPASTFPNGAGQVAAITNDIVGAQTIRLRQNITVGALYIGDGIASNLYNTTIANNGSETYALTFDSGAAGVAAAVYATATGTPTITFSAPVALNSDLLAGAGGFNSTNAPRLAFSGPLAMNGRTLTFTNGVAGQNQYSFEQGASLTGDGTVVNNAQTVVSVTGSKAFAGRIVANRGTGASNTGSFTLTSGGFTNAAEFVINGYLYNGSIQAGGVIHSGHNSGMPANPGQRWTTRQVTLNGGSLDDGGQAASNNSGNPTNNWQRGLEYVQDNVATVLLNSAFSYIGVNASSTTTGTILNVAALVRAPGATVYVNGPNASNKLFLAANGAGYLKGAGGPLGSKSQSVIPWAGLYASGGTANPGGFGTYVEGAGFRGLFDAEYTNRVMAGADYNVSVDNVVLTNDCTVNALRMGYLNAPNNNIGTNRTLTVASGGVFFQVGDRLLGSTNTPNAGTLNFGAAEGVVWVIGANTNVIGARITGTGGLTKTSTGTLTLTGPNSYSGDTHVSGGALRVGDGLYGSNLGPSNVYVHVGATLVLSCSGAIADSAAVSLDRYGLFNARMQLDPDINETVRFLYLAGAPMPRGTYGGSASAAAYKNDTFFAGTGVLTVTGDATARWRGTVISVR
jgi:autotransporter-associated beta strand protein